MNLYNIIIENGVYIIFGCSYLSLKYPLLSFYIYLKSFSANYYFCFSKFYPNPSLYKWKHLIRLTDTGHYANFLFYFYPEYLPISHNILFVITFAYYITKCFFNMKDTDDRVNKQIIQSLQIIHCEINHTFPYMIVFYHNTQSNYIFDNNTLIYSYLWVYIWLIFIWGPWILMTGDPVYSILDKKTPFTTKMAVVLIMHLLVYIANYSGYLINHVCNLHSEQQDLQLF
uniref:Uncharacterized protein n=1 Tax=viral metagenome TaxID=1070528 RepID=A0A6C0BSC9_9ZZZZ